MLNLAIDWMHERLGTRARISYNVQGSRIDAMGTRQTADQALPDIYELPRHLVDVAVTQPLTRKIDVKVTVENLFNSPVRLVQGTTDDNVVGSDTKFPARTSKYYTGQTVWLSLIYNL